MWVPSVFLYLLPFIDVTTCWSFNIIIDPILFTSQYDSMLTFPDLHPIFRKEWVIESTSLDYQKDPPAAFFRPSALSKSAFWLRDDTNLKFLPTPSSIWAIESATTQIMWDASRCHRRLCSAPLCMSSVGGYLTLKVKEWVTTVPQASHLSEVYSDISHCIHNLPPTIVTST